jgi:hypothetical protein
MLLSPMFSSPISSPTNRSPLSPPFHSNLCHPERSEGSAFLFSAIRALIVFLGSPLFSYSCALFCHNENGNLFAFRRFPSLFSNHPGWGTAIVNFFVAEISNLHQQITSHRLGSFPSTSPESANHRSISPVESALQLIAPVTPVESALPKRRT